MRHQKMLRVFSLILAAVLLLSTPVYAADYTGAEDAIRDGFASDAEEIGLEEYGLLIEDLREIFYGMINDNELPWYADSFSFTYDTDTNIVLKLIPKNMDENVYDRDAYERAVAEVLEEAVFPGMSQWQIALSVHDYLVSHYCYDETYTYYEGYDLLVGGTAVCEGYARAYMDILKRAGLEVIYASSEGMNHGWNLVKIGSNWYHVDVTWDDPITDCYGKVRHHYFLVDDDMIADADHNHYGWEAGQSADSADLNTGRFWQETDSQICYESAAVSYIRIDDSNEHWIYRRDEQTGELTELTYFDAGYIDVGYGSYHYQNYGLSLWNGKLYFSDMENVYAMNTDGSDKTVIYSYDAEANGNFIRGSFVDEGIIYITLGDHNDEIYTSLEIPVPGYTPHEHSYTEERVEATCTSEGYVIHICSCGDSYKTDTVQATGHSYDGGVVTQEATASADGLLTYTCIFCGDTYTESIPATGSAGAFPTDSPAEPTEMPTLPSGTDDNRSEGGGFPVIPVVIGVAVLAVIVLLAASGKGKKKSQKNPAPVSGDPYGDSYGGSGDYDSGYGGYSGDSYSGSEDYAGGYSDPYSGDAYGDSGSYGDSWSGDSYSDSGDYSDYSGY